MGSVQAGFVSFHLQCISQEMLLELSLERFEEIRWREASRFIEQYSLRWLQQPRYIYQAFSAAFILHINKYGSTRGWQSTTDEYNGMKMLYLVHVPQQYYSVLTLMVLNTSMNQSRLQCVNDWHTLHLLFHLFLLVSTVTSCKSSFLHKVGENPSINFYLLLSARLFPLDAFLCTVMSSATLSVNNTQLSWQNISRAFGLK